MIKFLYNKDQICIMFSKASASLTGLFGWEGLTTAALFYLFAAGIYEGNPNPSLS